MSKIIKAVCILTAAFALFAAGVLYTVYNSEITWGRGANTTMTIYLHGLCREFPAYNACEHEEMLYDMAQ